MRTIALILGVIVGSVVTRMLGESVMLAMCAMLALVIVVSSIRDRRRRKVQWK